MTFQSHSCENLWAPLATSVTTTVVTAILIIVTVPGNLLICWAVIWNPTRNLRSPFNYLVLNLAVADLVVGAVTEPVFVGFHLIEALEHKNVQGARWVVYMSYLMSSSASVLSMVALAVNRHQLATQNSMRQSKTSTVIVSSALVWLFSLGFPLIYLAVDFYTLAFAFLNTAVIVSTGVLVFAYYGIYRNLQQHHKNTEHIRGSGDRCKNEKWEEKITVSFLLIILSFVACAIPSLIMIYVVTLCATCSCVLIHWCRDLQHLFLLGNSASNQFLYAWRMRSFRRAFQTISVVQSMSRRFSRKRVHQASPQLDEEKGQEMGSNPSENGGKQRIAHCKKKIALTRSESQTDSLMLSFCEREEGSMRKKQPESPKIGWKGNTRVYPNGSLQHPRLQQVRFEIARDDGLSTKTSAMPSLHLGSIPRSDSASEIRSVVTDNKGEYRTR